MSMCYANQVTFWYNMQNILKMANPHMQNIYPELFDSNKETFKIFNQPKKFDVSFFKVNILDILLGSYFNGK